MGSLPSHPKEEVLQETAWQSHPQQERKDQEEPHGHSQGEEKGKEAFGGFQEDQHDVSDGKSGEDELPVSQEKGVGQGTSQDAGDGQEILFASRTLFLLHFLRRFDPQRAGQINSGAQQQQTADPHRDQPGPRIPERSQFQAQRAEKVKKGKSEKDEGGYLLISGSMYLHRLNPSASFGGDVARKISFFDRLRNGRKTEKPEGARNHFPKDIFQFRNPPCTTLNAGQP
jgi:hypothetical protein